VATAAELIREAARQLRETAFDSPRLDAEVLLRHVLDLDRTHLFVRMHEPVPDDLASDYALLIEERLTGMSVAYLIGQREFMGLAFAVGPGVLVPRPETELLVEWALTRIREHPPKHVVDVGTGSGAIILSLAKLLDGENSPMLIGCDLSSHALEYARRNRASLDLSSMVHLVQGDLLSWLGNRVDLVLANLPYLRPDQVVDNRDIQSEPEISLISGEDGFHTIETLIAELPRVLAPGGAVVLELDPDQAERAASMMTTQVPGARSSVILDLSGRKRFVIAELSSTALS